MTGCEYCDSNTLLQALITEPLTVAELPPGTSFRVILFRNLNGASGYMDVNYCPLCGRDLRGETEGSA